MRRPSGKTILLAAVAVCGLVGWLAYSKAVDSRAAAELSQPPALVKVTDQSRSLFDGQSTTGWTIEGPHRITDGTLVLGGAEPVRAVLQRPVVEGERVSFDFFQEGSPDVKLLVRTALIAPQSPDPEFVRDIPVPLDLSELAYRRWHAVTMTIGRSDTNAVVETNFRAHHDGIGLSGGAKHSFPARGGARFRFEFSVPAGAGLSLRNVLVGGDAG